MKEIIFNRKNYKSYEDFYKQIYKELDGKHNIEFEDCEDLHYSADRLWEFLMGYYDEAIKYIFLNFDKEKIKEEKNYNDYKYKMILEIFEEFTQKYPNNKLEFKMENDK